jgi:NADH-quinone oxidoreductase subunit C
MADISILFDKLSAKMKSQLTASENGQAIYVNKEKLISIMKILKADFKYWLLTDITSVDYIDYYEVVYHLMNDEASLICIKVRLEKSENEVSSVPSITSIWKAADPQEREVYDLMGIEFEGHPNLKRILCPDDFKGHPLQKSFKLDIPNRF